MANAIPITLVGNIGGGDPELRFTPSGAAVAKFRMAQTERYLDRTSNEWKDREPVWLTVTVWRDQAENVAETLKNGDAVIVSGRLNSRTYEDKEGQKRTVFEVEADVVGASLARATAVVTRKKNANGGGGSGQRGDDAWEGASTNRPQGQRNGGQAANANQARQQQPAQSPSDDW